MATENSTFVLPSSSPVTDGSEGGFSFVNLFIKSLYTLIGITGIAGNGLVLAMLIKIPSLRNTTNLLIGHQSVTDFASSILLMATFLPPPLNDMTVLSVTNPTLAVLICKFWVGRLFYWTAIKASTANLVYLTLERYIAVVHPLKYRERLKPREASIICGSIWIIGLLVQIYVVPTYSIMEGICSISYRRKSLQVFLGIWVFSSTLVIPLVVMTFVYVSIFLALPRKVAPTNISISHQVTKDSRVTSSTVPTDQGTCPPDMLQEEGGSVSDAKSPQAGLRSKPEGTSLSQVVPRSQNDGNIGNERSNQAEIKRDKVRRNVLSTMVIVCITYTICWTPNQIYFLYFNLGGTLDFNSGLYYFTVIASAMNMCVNPIIYAFKYKKFQDGMKQLVFGKSFSQSNDSTAGSNPRS
ncbi:5-hydroxytryptamine receptor 1A [Holothuria leucospilota]|uniref:5-hydroxytryptamine receptor 1A n=1 Tax=Holothuria leucospilota TaxID=206669 RepID=A0A9Q1BLL3_HOLLE|nr:5-hydroxytryptamine receptor 1A [Holothuria leucospilota]